MATINYLVLSSKKKGYSTIYLRFTYGRSLDVKMATPLRIDPTLWNPQTQNPRQSMNKADRLTLQQKLKGLEKYLITSLNSSTAPLTKDWVKDKLDEYFHPDKPKDVVFLTDYLEKMVGEMETGERKFLKRTKGGNNWVRFGRGTITQYKTTFKKHLTEYEKARNIRLSFDDITMDLYYDLIRFQESIPYRVNTIGNSIKNLKALMAAAEKDGLHHNPVYRSDEFVKPTEEVENVYLNEQEIQKIAELHFSEEERQLEEERDVFLVGCHTAPRFGDYSRISWVHITTTGKGRRIIRMETGKTNTLVDIPIKPELEAILKKYNYTMPYVIEQYLNRDIKSIARRAGITSPVRITEIKNGKKIDKAVEKCTRITTHTARRSGATNMYKAGIPTISIMKITAHTTEKSFLKYICIDREENAEMLYDNSFFSGGLRIAK